jgi:hypothetical protein
MLQWIVGIFLVLHGLVHLLYFGQAMKFFELQPGMVWPQGSWAFSRLGAADVTRLLAGIACIMAAIAFIAGATGIFTRQSWWRPLIVGAAAFSSVLYLIFWNGSQQRLPDQGAVGLLIDLAILAAVLLLRWPVFEP